jgi:hypothetical protein
MKSNLSLIQERLDACKKEVTELEEMNKQIKNALNTIPFTPRHRQQIKTAFHRCAKKITILKSRILTVAILSMHTDKIEGRAISISKSSR